MIGDGRTPVAVVSGFLGSGKTTLVNRLVAALPDSLVVVNELGAVPVDHHLLERSDERTIALPDGCLCCRLRGDLEETLIGAAMRRRRGEIAGFDRVIVETSGLADPGPVAQTLFADQGLGRDFKLGPVLTVVDAAGAEGRRRAPDIARAQIAAADVVVLSKADRASDLSAAEEEVRSVNPQAVRLAARFGDIDPSILGQAAKDPAPRAAAAHPAGIRSFVLDLGEPVARALLERFLAILMEMRGADLLRVKGIVRLVSGECVAVQGVRHVFDRLRPVARASGTGLVFITQRLEEAEVEALWRAMQTLQSSASAS